MENAFFFDGDLVDRAGIRKHGDAAAKSRLLEYKPRAVIAAVLFVGRDCEADRRAGAPRVEVAEELQQNRELPFHVAATGAVNTAVAHGRAILRSVGTRDDVDMREQQDLRALDAERQDDGGRAAVGVEPPHVDTVALGVIDDELHAALDLVGTLARARYEDEIAGELDEAAFEDLGRPASRGHSPIPPAARSTRAPADHRTRRDLFPGRGTVP